MEKRGVGGDLNERSEIPVPDKFYYRETNKVPYPQNKTQYIQHRTYRLT